MFNLSDRFDDPMRAKVAHLQAETAGAVRLTCADVGLPLIDVPSGLDTSGRVAWIARRVDSLLGEATGQPLRP